LGEQKNQKTDLHAGGIDRTSRGRRGGLLHERFRSARRLSRLWYVWLVLFVVAATATWVFMRPAPPTRIVIATSSRNGQYYKLGEEYAKTFKDNGVTLSVRETAGTTENYQLLQEGPGTDDNPGAAIAIVAGGQATKDLQGKFRSIASLYFEPIWVFYRGESTDQLTGFAGKRIAVGAKGGGGRMLALQLLRKAGAINDLPDAEDTVSDTRPDAIPAPPAATQPNTMPATAPTTTPSTAPATELLPLGGRAAADALEAGTIDAAFLIAAPDSPLIKELLEAKATHGVQLLSFERHEAYARHFTYLSDVKLSRGVVDLARDLPDHDIHLLAPAANLIARRDLHPTIVPLLLSAVTHAPAPRGLLTTTEKFPYTDFGEFPLAPEAREYFQSGPPLLQRYLPFWLAAWVDRMKILLLPLITLLLPLARLAPPLYVWRIRARIYSWYRVLRHIDNRLRDFDKAGAQAASGSFTTEIQLLDEMDREVADVQVPLSYMAEFYTMRQHADFLRQEIARRKR